MNILGIFFFLTLFLSQTTSSTYVDIETVMLQGKGFPIIGNRFFAIQSVDGVGDFNGDGYDDVIVSAYGPVFVIYGWSKTNLLLLKSNLFFLETCSPDSACTLLPNSWVWKLLIILCLILVLYQPPKCCSLHKLNSRNGKRTRMMGIRIHNGKLILCFSFPIHMKNISQIFVSNFFAYLFRSGLNYY
jgi:hypothetical protein